jgi:hypothetical protein
MLNSNNGSDDELLKEKLAEIKESNFQKSKYMEDSSSEDSE